METPEQYVKSLKLTVKTTDQRQGRRSGVFT